MSSTALPGQPSKRSQTTAAVDSVNDFLIRCLSMLASLKLTIVLFSLAMFIVFVGSLAQGRRDVWLVVNQYFRVYVATIEVKDFFPPSLFPSLTNYKWEELGALQSFPFPGGWTIGWLMLFNLLAAHFLKFRVQARGRQLWTGIGVIALGVIATTIVVITGNAQMGVESGNFLLSATQIWFTLLAILANSSVVSIGLAMLRTADSRAARLVLGTTGIALGIVCFYFVYGGKEAQLNMSSMRILWQLLKGGVCSLILLLGCNLLFDKRGGIVLLHSGVALLMISELQVGLIGKESLLTLQEGQKLNYTRDVRERELAIIVPITEGADRGKDRVVVIPEQQLVAAAEATDADSKKILVESLPFDLAVRDFYRNSRLRPMLPSDKPLASTGLGEFVMPQRLEPVTGMNNSHDMSCLAIDLLDRTSGKVLHSLLVSQTASEMMTRPLAEQIRYSDNDYQFYLRFHRDYSDYHVELVDATQTNYVGSSTPRDFRSKIRIYDPAASEPSEFTLWMNNPLRYRGRTFYQSGLEQLPNGTAISTLSVVRNAGWMLPYIACMIVSFGMYAQFWQTLNRFLSRTERVTSGGVVLQAAGPAGSASLELLREKAKAASRETRDDAIAPATGGPAVAPATAISAERMNSKAAIFIPLAVVLLFAVWLGRSAKAPAPTPGSMNLYQFAQIPIAWNGRPQPIDSFARTQLLISSHKSTFEGELNRLELDAIRDTEILPMFKAYWPTIKGAESLEKFSGSYEEWIAELVRLTSSSEEAVEQRMRPVLTRRMPAVRWFLDTAADPALAARHRVIKIEDDQLLSALELPKRGGLTFSLLEVQKNLDKLQPVNAKAMQLQRDNQENLMSTMERRVAALFETVGRLESVHNMFQIREQENIVVALTNAWRIFTILGKRPAVMGVPTGAEEETQAWETLVGSSALAQLTGQMKARGITTFEEFRTYMKDKLPQETVEGSLRMAVQALNAMPSDGQAGGDSALQQKAARAVSSVDDLYLRRILAVVAAAKPGSTVDEMIASLPPEQVKDLASERISSDLFEIFQMLNTRDQADPRLNEIRRKLQPLAATDEKALAEVMNQELAKLAWEDLQARAGHLMPGGANSEVFEANTGSVVSLIEAWRTGDVERFNETLSTYQTRLAEKPLPHLEPAKVRMESWFNFYDPFFKAIYLYVPVMLLSFFGWLAWGKVLHRSAFWLMVLAFALHTVALGIRMWISGRPPVTNLYSSAIFIGWAAVVAAFVIERLLKNGIGNIVGAVSGASTLIIAHYLAREGDDTLSVMQAVLDTTFWLATHVVCITLGYAATFLAGGIGIAYCVKSWFAKSEKQEDLQMLGKLVYGVLCFAVFYSLVGTVLGGLWADDSWGRFWGWDPKENGAMLIVIWNAIVLHARWDKMVRDYGTSVLAVGGNIVTAWSWFGVNELQAGLHTYGFTEGRLLALLAFVASQFVFVVLAVAVSMVFRTKSSASSAVSQTAHG
ncbi:MAG: cytochrome c biogenesis protein CcsA [Planctomyces sp.]|nr:cytochrome c biogenesis protein CcsA [Planctomyces sp.]